MHAEFIIEPNTRAQYPDGLHKVRLKSKPKLLLSTLRLSNTNINIRRGVRSDAQLSSTETRFQECSQSGKTGFKHPMLSISMAFNVISCKKIERNTQKLKIADFTM